MAKRNKFYTAPNNQDIVDFLHVHGYDQMEDSVEEHTAELHLIINRFDRIFWISDTERLDEAKLMTEDRFGEEILQTTLNDIELWQN